MRTVIKRIATGFALGSLFWLSFAQLPPKFFSVVLVLILLQIIFFEWKNFFSIYRPMFWLLMPLYPILPFTLLIVMNQDPNYRSLLFILFIIVSSFDTGSYIAGNLFGKNLIAPNISPHKTWEGAIGGYFSTCIGLAIVLWQLELSKPWWFIATFTFIVCVLSLIGDMFESYLKRLAKIKDSGNILPGHGGFLDRFDGILFSVFFFFIFKCQLVSLFGL